MRSMTRKMRSKGCCIRKVRVDTGFGVVDSVNKLCGCQDVCCALHSCVFQCVFVDVYVCVRSEYPSYSLVSLEIMNTQVMLIPTLLATILNTFHVLQSSSPFALWIA